jgi:hypothetical protein
MGVSTDAILAFGFDLGDPNDQSLASRFGAEEEAEDGESFEFEEWIAAQAGAIYPAGHSGIHSQEYEAYAAKRDAAIAACPVEIITHCSFDYPMHFLAVRGTKTRAYRGTPQPVVAGQIPEEQIASMRSFCDLHGIQWQEPKWHIFSLWG